MMFVSRLLLIVFACGLLFSCGGTGTGNPEAQNQALIDGRCDPDPFVCADGSLVYRNPDLDCQFNPCPE